MTKDEDKIKAYFDFLLGDVKFDFKNGNIDVEKKIDDKLAFKIKEDIKRLIPSVKDIVFKEPVKDEKSEKKTVHKK